MTPPALDRLVKKCLAKEPEKRWQAASDVCDELKWIAGAGQGIAGGDAGTGWHSQTGVRERLGWLVAAVCHPRCGCRSSQQFFYFRRPPAEVRAVRFTISSSRKSKPFPCLASRPHFLQCLAGRQQGWHLSRWTLRAIPCFGYATSIPTSRSRSPGRTTVHWRLSGRRIAASLLSLLVRTQEGHRLPEGPPQTLTSLVWPTWHGNLESGWSHLIFDRSAGVRFFVSPRRVARRLLSLHSTHPASRTLMCGHTFCRTENTFSTLLIARIRKIAPSTLGRSIRKRRSSF